MAKGNEEDDSPALQAQRTPEAESLAAVVVRRTVSRRTNYLEYRDDLRRDFFFSCSYCTLTETEAQGVGFNIDHYMPREHYPALLADYTNLMWSCESCNRHKADYPEPGRVIGDFRVIKADVEHPGVHLALEDNSDLLTHRTTTGEFNIQLLRLNRQALRRLRAIRRKLLDSVGFIALGMSDLLSVSLDAVDIRHRNLFHRLRTQLGKEHDRIVTSLRELIEDVARSELLDTEPNRKQELAVRKAYLRSVRAIDPELLSVPAKKTPKARKTRASWERKAQRD